MARRRFFLTLYLSYILVIALCTVAVGWYALRTARESYLARTKDDLQAQATLVERQIAALFGTADEGEPDALCKTLGRYVSPRLTVRLLSGEVLGDSEADPTQMDDHSDRPEMSGALHGDGVGVAVRYSDTLRANMMYVAVPLRRGEETVGVVRAAKPLSEIHEALNAVSVQIIVVGLVVAVVVAVLSLAVSRHISRPLKEIEQGAQRFAQGDFSGRLTVPDYEEIATLAETLNRMATELDARLRTITEQKNTQEAVLSSMVEGVLAVDTEERVIDLNRAAARLLSLEDTEVRGRTIEEVLRNPDLQRVVAQTLQVREAVEQEIVLYQPKGERYVQVHGTVLRDGQGHQIGALVVLNDVTRLHQLENVRRDFVANVSHELRTPITSVKGFVETLLDGALADPQDAERFLRIVAKHADRLNAIIEDLLALSRLEQDAQQDHVTLEEYSIQDVLEAAREVCEVKASERDVEIALQCEERLRALVNPPLLEQAVANLIDNAIKYSEPGGRVHVEARSEEATILVSVQDWGCGIDKEHLPRLFERFYRVDKARSRKLGGTGLGLAIVKHIALVHGGNVSVESALREGSTFTIHLPLSSPESDREGR